MTQKLFEVTERIIDGVVVIKILEGEFKNVEFTFGGVSIEEKNNSAILKFNYNIISGKELIIDEDIFKQISGNILVELLDSQLNNNEVLYIGGT